MVGKIRKTSGRKVDPALIKEIGLQMQEFMKIVEKQTDEKINEGYLKVRDEFAGIVNGLMGAVIGGRLDARSLANAAARGAAPLLRDYINKSLSQQGDDFLGLISKAQRNL